MLASPASRRRGTLEGMWPSELSPNPARVSLPALIRPRLWVPAAVPARAPATSRGQVGVGALSTP